jgi:flagellin-like hook-associated protein FlgL
MADITLTAAVRSNLSTLQSTADLIGSTQERLSTGKKVNSALDNPNSFFTASSLNARASDLGNLQDDIGQSVSTLEASDKGIKGIDKLLSAAQGKANQALQTEDIDERAKYAAEFNELRTQIEDIAKDSGYKGKNLLGGEGNDLRVKFNEDGSSDLTIGAVDYTDLSGADSDLKLFAIGTTVGEVKESDGTAAFDLGVTPADNTKTFAAGTGEASGELATSDTAGLVGTSTLKTLNNFDAGDKITITSGAGGTPQEVEIAEGDKASDIAGKLQTALQATGGNNSAATVTVDDVTGELKIAAANDDAVFQHTDSEGREVNSELDGLDTSGGTPNEGAATLKTTGVSESTTVAQLDNFAADDKIVLTSASDPTQTRTIDLTADLAGNATTAKELADEIEDQLESLNGNNRASVVIEDGEIKISNSTGHVNIEHQDSAGNAKTDSALKDVKIVGSETETQSVATPDIKLTDLQDFKVGDKIEFKQGDGSTQALTINGSSTITEDTTVQQLTDALDSIGGVSASLDADGKITVDNTTADDNGLDITFSYEGKGAGAAFGDATVNTISADKSEVAGRGWGSDELIEDSLDQVRKAQLDLRAQASTFGTNLSVVTNRQDFTKELINTLETGAGKLTLADTNLEGANLAALNTQQQIATSTLGLAARANQSVLQLIR